MKTTLKTVDIVDVDFGDRVRDDMGNIEALRKSIKEKGLITPITLMEKEDGTYLLLAGGRRLTALISLDEDKVPAKIYPKMEELQRKAIELAENVDRKQLTFSEEALITKQIHELMVAQKGKKIYGDGHGAKDTAEMLGVSTSTVRSHLELADALEVAPEIATQCETGSQALSLIRHAKKTIKQEAQAKQYERKVKSKGLDERDYLLDAYKVGDFFEGIKEVEPATYDFIEIDPPYGIDLNSTKKGYRADTSSYEEIPKDEYEDFLMETFKACGRVLKPGGWLICWHGIEWYELVRKCYASIKLGSPILPVIWAKGRGQTTNPKLVLANTYETFSYGYRNPASLVNMGASNLFTYPPLPPTSKTHPTQKPIKLLEDIFGTFASKNTRALVPFLGSGASILALDNLHVRAEGWDLSKDYKLWYDKKVREGIPHNFGD